MVTRGIFVSSRSGWVRRCSCSPRLTACDWRKPETGKRRLVRGWLLQWCNRRDRKTGQDHIAFKTIEVPILGMDGAMDSWKTRMNVYNSKIGVLASPPGSGDPCQNFEKIVR